MQYNNYSIVMLVVHDHQYSNYSVLNTDQPLAIYTELGCYFNRREFQTFEKFVRIQITVDCVNPESRPGLIGQFESRDENKLELFGNSHLLRPRQTYYGDQVLQR